MSSRTSCTLSVDALFHAAPTCGHALGPRHKTSAHTNNDSYTHTHTHTRPRPGIRVLVPLGPRPRTLKQTHDDNNKAQAGYIAEEAVGLVEGAALQLHRGPPEGLQPPQEVHHVPGHAIVRETR